MRLRLIVVVCIYVFPFYIVWKVGVVVNQLGIQSAIRLGPKQQSPDPRSHVDRNLTWGDSNAYPVCWVIKRGFDHGQVLNHR